MNACERKALFNLVLDMPMDSDGSIIYNSDILKVYHKFAYDINEIDPIDFGGIDPQKTLIENIALYVYFFLLEELGLSENPDESESPWKDPSL